MVRTGYFQDSAHPPSLHRSVGLSFHCPRQGLAVSLGADKAEEGVASTVPPSASTGSKGLPHSPAPAVGPCHLLSDPDFQTAPVGSSLPHGS